MARISPIILENHRLLTMFSACVSRLVEEGRVAIIAVVHVDDTFSVGLKSRYFETS